jgi:hypothetical protein
MRTTNGSLSIAHRTGAALTTSLFAFATLTAYAPAARADETTISSTGKGVTGGALLGGELVVIVESIANVHSPAAYIVGAILGAGAGGVGGYFVEHNSSDGKAPVFMLAGGIGLIIPALVLALNATRYLPNEGASEDRAPTNAPLANPGVPGGSSVAPAGGTPAPVPTPPPPAPAAKPPLSLFDMNGGTMRLGVPVPEIRPTFSAVELRQYGVAQQTEVRMPLVKIAF